MILLTVAVHHVYQRFDIFRFDVGGDAVSQVEHVAAARAVAVEDGFGFALDGFDGGRHYRRVEVALQRYLVTDALARLADVHCPVEADCIHAGASHGLQPVPAAFSEDDDRDGFAILFAIELVDDALHRSQ